MGKRYTVTGRVRFINRLVEILNRLGLGGRDTYTLTTIGRKSGRPRSTPVTVATVRGIRYLVSPYGEVGWVHNIRACGEKRQARGRRETAFLLCGSGSMTATRGGMAIDRRRGSCASLRSRCQPATAGMTWSTGIPFGPERVPDTWIRVSLRNSPYPLDIPFDWKAYDGNAHRVQ